VKEFHEWLLKKKKFYEDMLLVFEKSPLPSAKYSIESYKFLIETYDDIIHHFELFVKRENSE
jgi:hypothetical protein